MPDLGPIVEVHLLQLPIAVHARAEEHGDELIREFALIAERLRDEGERPPLPVRLVALVNELTSQYSRFTAEEEDRLASAVAAGESEIDLVFRVPAAAAEAARHLGEIMDEADDYCRAGEHLLTLATPEEALRYRRWYLDQFIDQIAGGPPVPWPAYRG